MRTSKKDLLIIEENNLYRIAIKKPFLLFFYKWVELTYQTEQLELPMEFKTIQEAEIFINEISYN